MSRILDASALLALLNDEPGADYVASALGLRDATPIVTADRAWDGLPIGLEFEWLR